MSLGKIRKRTKTCAMDCLAVFSGPEEGLLSAFIEKDMNLQLQGGGEEHLLEQNFQFTIYAFSAFATPSCQVRQTQH